MEMTGRDRRLARRFGANLRCIVSLPIEERDILFPHTTIIARTRDVSESGIGLVAPSIYLGFDCIIDEGRTLNLSLTLPAGVVELKATAAHYLRLDESDDKPSYIIGLRITGIADDSRARYAEYLAALDANAQSSDSPAA